MRSRDQEDPEATGVFELPERNANTLFLQDPASDAADAPSPRDAFLVAYDRIADLSVAARRPSFVVAAVSADRTLISAQIVEVGRTMTIGRHTMCRLVLPSERISLRHVVALVLLDEHGAPVLRVWDLNTRMPFRTEDGEPNGAIVADGPAYFSIGSFAIWCLPCKTAADLPPRAMDAWNALPARDFVDRKAPVASERRAGVDAFPPARRHGGPYRDHERSSRITSLAPPLLLGDDDEPELAWAIIRLSSNHSRAKRNVSAERLEQGLLIGRYERCGLSLGDIDMSVSRVHLLLVRIGADVWAVDTGSSNGVRRNGKKIEAIVLEDSDSLVFGAQMTLDWKKLEHAQA